MVIRCHNSFNIYGIFMKFRVVSLIPLFMFLVCFVSCGDHFSESKFAKLENRTTTKQV